VRAAGVGGQDPGVGQASTAPVSPALLGHRRVNGGRRGHGGLRIELLDAESQTFFASGSAALATGTEKVLQLIARELGELKNSIVIEGHTDSRPYTVTDIYSNWELSSDRANAARRVMERSGLRGGQVSGVRGYADRQLRVRELASGGARPPSKDADVAPASAAPTHTPRVEGPSPH
jgi:outer membrane protein OmpA-like peptidoglycan-associated protein